MRQMSLEQTLQKEIDESKKNGLIEKITYKRDLEKRIELINWGSREYEES